MKILLRVSDAVDKVWGFIVIALFMVMTVTYSGQIVLRYVFQTGFIWTDELTRYLDVWAIMVGIGLIAKRRNHINVSILEEFLPKTPRAWLIVIQQVFSLIFFSLMFYFSFDLIKIAGTQLSTNMRIPKAWVYSIFPVAFAVFVFQTFVSIVKSIKEART
jgi:TRAP-type C4-dicarboxylate transport system permease small subunit